MKNKIKNLFNYQSLCHKNSSDCDVIRESLEKLIFYFAISVIFSIAFIMRFTLYNVPFSGPDTIGYLGVAFQYLDKGLFSCIAERSYPYPLFLTIILGLFKDVSAITAIQHALGIISGLFFLRIWFLVDLFFLKLSKLRKYFYWFIGIFGLYVLMCSDWSVYIEHHSHPESLTSFLITSLVLVHLKFYKTCVDKSSFASIAIWAIASFLINYLIFTYQPRYGLNLIFVFGLFCVILFKNLDIKRSVQIIILSVATTYILLVLPFHDFAHKGPIKANRSAALFFHNLKTIAPIIEDDLKNKEMDSKEKLLLEDILSDLEKAKDPNNNYGTGYNKSLGLNTDYFNKTYYRILESKGSFSTAADFYTSYFNRAIISHPFLLALKVIKEFFIFYSQDLIFNKSINPQTSWVYSYNVIKSFKSHFPNTEVLDKYENSLEFISKNSQVTPFENIYSNIIAIEIYAKKLLPVIIILFTILFTSNLRWRSKYYEFGIFVFILMILQFGFNATISIANTNSVTRYLYDQLILIILFESFAVIFVVFCIANLYRNSGIKNLK